MTDFDVQASAARLKYAESVADVDAVFADIKVLPEADQKGAVTKLEALYVADMLSDLETNKATITELKAVVSMLDQAKGTMQGQFLIANMESQLGGPDGGMAMSQVFLNIHNALGDESHAFTKAYVASAAKLPDDEYSTTLGQLKIMTGAVDGYAAVSKPAVSNPFRKPAGPSAP